MKHSLRSVAAACLLPGAAFAQAPTAGSLPPVTVTGNPLGATELVAPVLQSSGTGLLLRQQPTLGETLEGLPGVSSTYFGPTASRPTIRGLDGDRIRILQGSGATLDASSISYDHAVAADPLVVERIEVLRGPAALLYGGNAIGGVVNLIDNRIPKAPVPGITGRADLSAASGSRERSAALLLEGGSERIGLHADVSDRTTRHVRVPVELGCTRGGVTSLARRICNSASEVRSGAVGGSVFFHRGYLGLSTSEYRTDYGAVAEDEVTIDLRSRRTAVEGFWKDVGPLRSLKAQVAHTDYRHTEFDAGVPGTLFTHQGGDLRLEARHAPVGALEGVIGVQVERNRFSAEGAEAFAPPSRTRQQALFVHEELGTSWGKLTFGARRESVEVESIGSAAAPRFTPARRQFTPTSWSAGALWKLAPAWQATGTIARSQRAPRDYELFADGPHVATGAYEVGNPALDRERSTSLEAGLQWTRGPNRFAVHAFHTRFRNYVALLATGVDRDAGGNAGVTDCGDGTSVESGCVDEVLPEFAYQGVAARFRGLEVSGNLRLLDAGDVVDLEWRGDLVRATNLTLGEPLPRIAPARVGATLAWSRGPWGARLGFDHRARQSRVPAGEQPVAGYTLWNAALTYKAKAGLADLLWYARVENAGDRLAYTATSILTQSAPGRVPLPGRSVRLGVRADF